jgi:CheY-like chemotaxis protein
MANCKVMVCSPNLDLAMLRAAVLRTAGCEVICPVSQQDALHLMHEESFDVLLVCYEFSEEAGMELCDEFKRTNPQRKILQMRKNYKEAACPDVADTVHALEGPGALIRAVLE